MEFFVIERAIDLDHNIVNVNGSGIALGHPIGNTGCRIGVTLIYEMEKRGLKLNLAELCGESGHNQSIIIQKAKRTMKFRSQWVGWIPKGKTFTLKCNNIKGGVIQKFWNYESQK